MGRRRIDGLYRGFIPLDSIEPHGSQRWNYLIPRSLLRSYMILFEEKELFLERLFAMSMLRRISLRSLSVDISFDMMVMTSPCPSMITVLLSSPSDSFMGSFTFRSSNGTHFCFPNSCKPFLRSRRILLFEMVSLASFSEPLAMRMQSIDRKSFSSLAIVSLQFVKLACDNYIFWVDVGMKIWINVEYISVIR